MLYTVVGDNGTEIIDTDFPTSARYKYQSQHGGEVHAVFAGQHYNTLTGDGKADELAEAIRKASFNCRRSAELIENLRDETEDLSIEPEDAKNDLQRDLIEAINATLRYADDPGLASDVLHEEICDIEREHSIRIGLK